MECKMCVAIFLCNFFSVAFLFQEEPNESCIVIYAHVVEHCRAFFLLLQICEPALSDLRRFSLRENSFDAVTEKLVKFELPDTLVGVLFRQYYCHRSSRRRGQFCAWLGGLFVVGAFVSSLEWDRPKTYKRGPLKQIASHCQKIGRYCTAG